MTTLVLQVTSLRSPAAVSDTRPCCCETLYILSPVVSLGGALNPLLLNIFVRLSSAIMIDPQELTRILYAYFPNTLKAAKMLPYNL